MMIESSHQVSLRNPYHCVFTLKLMQNTSSVPERMACGREMLSGYEQILLEEVSVDGSHVPSLED